jgi:hypothetical protein
MANLNLLKFFLVEPQSICLNVDMIHKLSKHNFIMPIHLYDRKWIWENDRKSIHTFIASQDKFWWFWLPSKETHSY